MAGLARKELFGIKNESANDLNENGNLMENGAPVISEHDLDEPVCSTSSSDDHPNEILLYVDNQGVQGVQDLIRVTLNPSMSSEDLQQQLHNAGANITLQGLGDVNTIISNGDNGDNGDKTLVHQSAPDMSDQGDNEKTNNATKLFCLANLSDNLTSDQDQHDEGFMGSELDIGEIKSESLDDVSVTDTDGTVNAIEDFIIANVNVAQKALIPGEFVVGNAFYSLEEVEDALRLYEETHNVKLYKRDVRSLEALMKRSLKLQRLDKINESLKYGQLLYCCVYGGKRRAQKMACIDECGIARYTDCKMFIRFAISDDGMKLVVNGKLETHNHEEVVAGEPSTEPLYISNTGNADEIRLGAGFVDLEELYKAIHKYETDNHVHLWRRDGRTVEALAKRAPGTARKIMETNPGLRFAELRFCCSYGGRQLSEDKREKMRITNSFKQGCEMHIRFGVSDDGSQLIVKSMSEDHNHEINEETIVKEALHPELCSYVSKLVWNDINIGIEEVRKRLEIYVFDEMFKDQTPPPRTRRQYFPSKKQIRYFMAKAKASLNITQEAEMKLEAQAEKLKETRGDEKMIFNFKMQTHDTMPSELVINSEESVVDVDGEFFTASSTAHETKPIQTRLVSEVHNTKILFCHQTPHQQRLMKRYSSQLIVTQISDIHSKIPFPLFCLYVQTNVDFQLVGEFILQSNTSLLIIECLQSFKEWNPGWNPKFVIVDFSEEQINAVENIFPGTFVLISDTSREKAWSDWLSIDENEVYEHKEKIMTYLQAIATSYSEDTLNTAARELEESDVWRMSDKLRNWFQINWLSQAKRWVAGYRPDDYLMCSHHGRTLECELKVFKSIKLVNKSAPLHDVIQQIVDHVAPVARKQYEILNQESVKLQNELKYLYSDIPNYLTSRPGKLTYHVYERLKSAAEKTFTLSCLHPGIFSVQGSGGEDNLLHTISFGDLNSFPSCDCHDWQQFKLPCVHLCAVFNSYPGWTWDMLSVAYKSSPVLNVDWSLVTENLDVPGHIIDKSTQTSEATLISNSPHISRMNKMADSRHLTETPQVLASQCRGLLQQLSKLQLAHHTRDNLYRLKSELKELISTFSNAPKQKFAPITLTDMYVIQSKGPGRPRKLIPTDSKSGVVQSVFEQYNVAPVTLSSSKDNKRVVERKVYPSRNRTPSQLVISRPPGEPASVQQRDNNIVGTVYIVDSTKVLVKNSTQNIITHNQLQSLTQNQLQTTTKLKPTVPIVKKRIHSPSVFLKPQEKRRKDDNMMDADHSFNSDVSLEFSQENVDYVINNTIHKNSLHDEGLHDDTLLTVDENPISNDIDNQTINIQLEQVSDNMDTDVTGSIDVIGEESMQTGTLQITNTIDRPSSPTNILEASSSSTNILEVPSSSTNILETPSSSTNMLETPSSSIDSIEPSSTSIDMVVMEINTLGGVAEENEAVSEQDIDEMSSGRTIEESQVRDDT